MKKICNSVVGVALASVLTLSSTAFAATKQPFELLHQFDIASEGRGGAGGMTMGLDGRFYGVLPLDGPGSGGAAYAVDKHGTFSLLHAFNLWSEGGEATGPLVRAEDGTMYGMLGRGGAHGCGAIFRLSPVDGSVSLVHSFEYETDGCWPHGSLAMDARGRLYGTTSAGAGYEWGSVFRWEAGKRLKVLHHFTHADGDGGYSLRGVTLSADGRSIVGATYRGGSEDHGVIFQVQTDGSAYRVLRSFADDIGTFASGDMVLAKDGNLYGVATFGGPNHDGTIYRVTPAGDVSLVRAFDESDAFGIQPGGRLAVGHHGKLYGTTTYGGANNNGTVYELQPDGTMTVLYAFDDDDENGYFAGGGLLFQHGYLYVTTGARHQNPVLGGTIFRINKP